LRLKSKAATSEGERKADTEPGVPENDPHR
jgi:hypothetical protein